MVIGEVGGSSSRWALVQDDAVHLFPIKGTSLPGYNPLSGDPVIFQETLRAYFHAHGPAVFQADQVHVYGAGCGEQGRATRMQQALAPLWQATTAITVHSDLLGAARGELGNASGLVLILGTGMNAGYYTEGRLHTPMPSLGWILGDEGSGADIGRVLLQDAFHGRMPLPVREVLFGPEGPDLATVLEEVYRSPFPARALAARTALLQPLIREPYVHDLLTSRFHALADLLLGAFTAEQAHEVWATGSVAWGFREVLGDVLLDRGMNLMDASRDPLPGLVRFHRPG